MEEFPLPAKPHFSPYSFLSTLLPTPSPSPKVRIPSMDVLKLLHDAYVLSLLFCKIITLLPLSVTILNGRMEELERSSLESDCGSMAVVVEVED